MDKDLKSMTNKVMLLEGEIHSLLDFARMLDERISEARDRYLDLNDQLHNLLRQTIKADIALEEMEENMTQFEQKGADENDTAKHSEGMFDLQRDILRRAEDSQTADREPDGADLSEMPGRETAEGAAELPPSSETEQGQASRLLRIELSREDANDLLTLVDITYNQVLDAKNCSDSDACLELAADFRRLYDNLQAAIENASESRLLEVRADGQNI